MRTRKKMKPRGRTVKDESHKSILKKRHPRAAALIDSDSTPKQRDAGNRLRKTPVSVSKGSSFKIEQENTLSPTVKKQSLRSARQKILSNPNLLELKNVRKNTPRSTPRLQSVRNANQKAPTSTQKHRNTPSSTPMLQTLRQALQNTPNSTPKLQSLQKVHQSTPTSTPKFQSLRKACQNTPSSTPKLQSLRKTRQNTPSSTPKLQSLRKLRQNTPSTTPKLQSLRKARQNTPSSTPKLQILKLRQNTSTSTPKQSISVGDTSNCSKSKFKDNTESSSSPNTDRLRIRNNHSPKPTHNVKSVYNVISKRTPRNSPRNVLRVISSTAKSNSSTPSLVTDQPNAVQFSSKTFYGKGNLKKDFSVHSKAKDTTKRLDERKTEDQTLSGKKAAIKETNVKIRSVIKTNVKRVTSKRSQVESLNKVTSVHQKSKKRKAEEMGSANVKTAKVPRKNSEVNQNGRGQVNIRKHLVNLEESSRNHKVIAGKERKISESKLSPEKASNSVYQLISDSEDELELDTHSVRSTTNPVRITAKNRKYVKKASKGMEADEGCSTSSNCTMITNLNGSESVDSPKTPGRKFFKSTRADRQCYSAINVNNKKGFTVNFTSGSSPSPSASSSPHRFKILSRLKDYKVAIDDKKTGFEEHKTLLKRSLISAATSCTESSTSNKEAIPLNSMDCTDISNTSVSQDYDGILEQTDHNLLSQDSELGKVVSIESLIASESSCSIDLLPDWPRPQSPTLVSEILDVELPRAVVEESTPALVMDEYLTIEPDKENVFSMSCDAAEEDERTSSARLNALQEQTNVQLPEYSATETSKEHQDMTLDKMKRLSPSNRSLHFSKRLQTNDTTSQMVLDLGQKVVAETCAICNMTYLPSDPEDCAVHRKHHQKREAVLHYTVRGGNALQENLDGSKIIRVLPDEGKEMRKVNEILCYVDEDLGCKSSIPYRAQIFLYVSERSKVIGVCVAQEITKAFRTLPDEKDGQPWSCCTTPEPARCGVGKIWVNTGNRRKRIATKLLDCVRFNFIMGIALDKNKLAFTDPTPDGKMFAERYIGTKEILVYRKYQ